MARARGRMAVSRLASSPPAPLGPGRTCSWCAAVYPGEAGYMVQVSTMNLQNIGFLGVRGVEGLTCDLHTGKAPR